MLEPDNHLDDRISVGGRKSEELIDILIGTRQVSRDLRDASAAEKQLGTQILLRRLRRPTFNGSAPLIANARSSSAAVVASSSARTGNQREHGQ